MNKVALVIAAIAISMPLTAAADDPENATVSTEQSVKEEQQVYTVNQGYCPCAPTRRDLKQYLNYASKSDTGAMERMANEGRLMVLREGDKVYIVENGFDIVKVRTLSGKEVYTFRECLDPK
jgi:hypothetical protein